MKRRFLLFTLIILIFSMLSYSVYALIPNEIKGSLKELTEEICTPGYHLNVEIISSELGVTEQTITWKCDNCSTVGIETRKNNKNK